MTRRWNVYNGTCLHGFGYVRSPRFNTSGPYTTIQFDGLGSTGNPPAERWRFNHGTTTLCIAVHTDGRVAIGGQPFTGGSGDGMATRVLSANGSRRWSVVGSGFTVGVAFDPDGNLIAVHNDSGGLVRKYDPDGTLIWSENHGAPLGAVATDGDGNIYVAGDSIPPQSSGNISVRKYDPDGDLLWSSTTMPNTSSFGSTNSLIVGGGGVYVGDGMLSTDSETLHKLDAADGSEIWAVDFPDGLSGASRFASDLAFDSDGNVVAIGEGGGTPRIETYAASNGALLSSTTPPARMFRMALDEQDHRYLANVLEASTADHHQRLNTSAVKVWGDSTIFAGSTRDVSIGPSGRLHVTGVLVNA